MAPIENFLTLCNTTLLRQQDKFYCKWVIQNAHDWRIVILSPPATFLQLTPPSTWDMIEKQKSSPSFKVTVDLEAQQELLSAAASEVD